MNHSELESLLDEYFTGTLSPELRREVEDVFRDREERLRLRDAFANLETRLGREIKRPELSANFHARMMRRIDKETSTESRARVQSIREQLEAEHQRRLGILRRMRLISGLGRLLDGVAWSAVAGIAIAFLCAWLIPKGDASAFPSAGLGFASPIVCFGWGMALLSFGLGCYARLGTRMMRWLK